MKRSRSTSCWLIAALAFVGLGCERTSVDQRTSTTLSVEQITGYFERGDCRGAQGYLNRFNGPSRTVAWYDYRSQAELVCGEDKSPSQEGVEAVAVLDEGLKRYPDSPRLLKSKAEVHESLGHDAQAAQFYAAARDAASSRVARGTASPDDESVLAELQGVRRVDTTPKGNIPTIDLRTSQDWTNRVPALVVAGKCREALSLLETVDARPIVWYEFASQAHATCFKANENAVAREKAVAAITEGIRIYPESVRLRLVRAALFESFGRQQDATQYYKETARMAEKAIATNAPDADESREILQALREQKKVKLQ